MSGTPSPGIPAHWRDENAGIDDRARKRRRLVGGLLAAVAGILTLGGLALYYVRPAVRCRLVPLCINSYRDPQWGRLPWRDQDRDALTNGGYFSQVVDLKTTHLDQARLVQHLRSLRAVSSHESIVVYLSGFARTDVRGGVRVFPADADPNDPATWLPLERVLDLLCEATTSRRLLILDLVAPVDPLRRTLLLDDVAAGIARDVEAYKNQGLLVLAACGPGQTVWTSEYLQRSVFNHYLEEGLRGQADSNGDGRVTVRELAVWLEPRVDRWARRARAGRQMPMLHGNGSDFTLVELPNGQPRPSRTLDEERTYPDWLAKAWLKVTGIPVREQALLAAEKAWRTGTDPEVVQAAVKSALKMPPPTPVAAPKPRSLALADRAAVPSELITDLRLLAARVETRTQGQPEDKAGPLRLQLIDEYLKATKEKTVTLTRAVLEVLILDQRPTTLQLFDAMLKRLEVEPQHLEVVWMHRLIALNLPRTVLQRSLELLRDSEQIASRQQVFPWIAPDIETVFQTRHNAYVLLDSHGYASQDAAVELLRQATTQLNGAASIQSSTEDALTALIRARKVLQAQYLRVAGAGRSLDGWRELTRQTAKLNDFLVSTQATGIKPKLGEVRGLTATLQTRLNDVEEPFTSDGIDRMVVGAKRPSGTPLQWRELDGSLNGLMVPNEQRESVYTAMTTLTRRLEDDVFQLDYQAGTSVVESLPYTAPDDEIRLRSQAEQAVAMLDLAGLDSDGREKLEGLLKKRFSRSTLADMEEDLRKGWASLARPSKSDSVLWAWLADRFRYARREYATLDPEGPLAAFYGRAANDYQRWLQNPREEYALIDSGELPRLLPASPIRKTLDIRVSALPGRMLRPRLRLYKPDKQWLNVRPQELPLPAPAGGEAFWPVPFEVNLLPGAGAGSDPQPQGLLAEVRLDEGRSFHRRIEIPLSPRTPEILLSGSPTNPEPALSSIRLRAIPGKQTVFLHVRNPIERTWKKLLVRMTTPEQTLTSTSFALAGKAKQKIVFLPPATPPSSPSSPQTPPMGAPPKAPELPELTGPLKIEIVDQEMSAVLTSRTVNVDLARPDEYVSITNVQFDPTANRNRLTVRMRLRHPMPGVKIAASLSFPSPDDGGPTIGTNTLTGIIPENLSELTLFADGVQSPSGKAIFFVNIDGWQRAFVFEATLTSRSVVTPQQMFDAEIRPTVNRVALAGPVLEVPVEVDNAPQGSRLEASLGRLVGGRFVAESMMTEKTPRYKRIGFLATDAKGALEFQAEISDWKMKLETSQRRGTRQIRVRLLDTTAKVIVSAEKTIILDNLPASGVQFVDLPKKAWRAAPLPVKARVNPGLVGIKAVNFFVGAPVENKLPAGVKTIPATAVGMDKTVWQANLPLPPTAKGPTEISVQVINAVGLSTFATGEIEATETDPAKTSPGIVKGVVNLGANVQPDVEVALFDEKNAVKGKTKTGRDGSFEFKDVAPGKYRLVTGRDPTGRIGVYPRPPLKTFDVLPGATVEASVPMFLP